MVNEMIRHLQRAENMYLETPTYNIVLQSLLEANEVSFHCIHNSVYTIFDGYILKMTYAD